MGTEQVQRSRDKTQDRSEGFARKPKIEQRETKVTKKTENLEVVLVDVRPWRRL